ncbi:MAG: helix-turn-helix domain-containing protein [Deltaproteobacteria bacterium]|jgi:transcriptional regulator with XRE-family HTH domain|nr:helix-turn-helix domain-containing protein [Deltaproteobacteria bacterium]MCL5880078.1 helix-turn-helix domain-containing protein [Deltaproteobacteria bacterium]
MKKLNNNIKKQKQSPKEEAKSHLKTGNVFNEIIGKLIRERRKELNLSPVNIAKYLNINYQTYSKYETGKITIPIENLFSIAKLLDVSIDSWLDLYYKKMFGDNYTDKDINFYDTLSNFHDTKSFSTNTGKTMEDFNNLIAAKIKMVEAIYFFGDKKLVSAFNNSLNFFHSLLKKDEI